MKLTSFEREKIDNSDDFLFYQNPRYVHHLGSSFRRRLTRLYSKYLLENHIILDLMSSWVSHLPHDVKYQKVIGHGLNESELIANKILDQFFIQDLNKKQNLPFEDSSIDTCLIVAGWQYLQYPEKISTELSRIIKSNSLLIISFTNRAFWTKAPNIWTNSTEDGRVEYVKKVISDKGWFVEKIFNEDTYEDRFFGLYKQIGDPFFSIIARNNKSNN
tara:strand:- start:28836 stop:29486 length:651 start_codon:yes stop_codon:yes gene_type:complete